VSPRIAPGKAIKACEAGDSRIVWTNATRNGYRPLRGLGLTIWFSNLGLAPQALC